MLYRLKSLPAYASESDSTEEILTPRWNAPRTRAMLAGRVLFTILAAWGLAMIAAAGTIVFSGTITQSTQDGTGPAVNNPALNSINDSDLYTVTLNFTGSITAPGLYNPAGASLVFSDPVASAIENSFTTISLSIVPDGSFVDLSLLGCLTTGTSCGGGNQLDANFQIVATALNSLGPVSTTGLDQPHPLDLLEDDGLTDIQGTIKSYSYRGLVATPEPSSLLLLGSVLACAAAWQVSRSAAYPHSRKTDPNLKSEKL